MWGYVLGAATLFGLIVTFGAWINGTLTRKVLLEHFAKMDQRFETLSRESSERFEALIKEMDQRFETLLKETSKRFEELSKQFNERFQALTKEVSKQHAKILEAIKSLKES